VIDAPTRRAELLCSPAGAALQAIRDDEQAASSLGVRVDTGKLRLEAQDDAPRDDTGSR
jgi:hypothetical protein